MGVLPPTVWRETDGNYDSEGTGLNFIVDTVGNFLVDTVGNFIIDTGVDMNVITPTVWTEDNSL